MIKERKQDKYVLKLQQLGKVYRLIEQFEEISRIDLSKLSHLAPATITSLTRQLINERLIIEKAVRNTENRGRPAIGLCVSPFFWQSLCAVLSEDRFDIFLCELDGTPLAEHSFPLRSEEFAQLDRVLVGYVQAFLEKTKLEPYKVITFSIAVTGELDNEERYVYHLGNRQLTLDLKALFHPYFKMPVMVTDYFQTWLFAESSVGSVIGCDHVLFLQLDERVNLSVLSQGDVLRCNKQPKMNIDKLITPTFNPIQHQLNPHLPETERHQIINQLTHQAIYKLIDLAYPDNQQVNNIEKIHFLCKKAQGNEAKAIDIIHHIADLTAYHLMCLVNMFSSKKVMLNTCLLSAKEIFLARLNQRLSLYHCNVEVVTSRYKWNSPEVLTAAIKQGIYDGSLLGDLLKNKEKLC
ncbi:MULTISPECIES: ROK family protein [unclassified Avibacterium]|uniref:ROK family protein n=1 Tax=unclassified Avibacterium TaxID=2685287 RepID=UPI00202638A0|nr:MULTISPECIES: ROK family protein [unclassified Avibacterium]MCW9698086.1 ROK family protein [Avibacterium sp. 20-129]MCW9718262.1 ROK family protein [Avibacterium sp. 21-599]URL05590.1 ROK family protein [Avibacterium sp. 21-595]